MQRLTYIFYQLKRKLKFSHLAGFLSLVVALVWLVVLAYPDDQLHLVFCDVGQGDAILISRKFDQVLIDGGPDESVLACLSEHMPFWDKTIEVVALTHPQADHLTGLISVLERYEVIHFFFPPAGNKSAGYSKLIQLVESNQSLKVQNIYSGDKIKIGDLILETVWPQKEWALAQLDPRHPDGAILGASTSRNLNDFSLIFHLQFGEFDALLAGDADSKIQDEIMTEVNIPHVEVIKIPHHGSKYSMIDEFLGVVKPDLAIMSVGRNSFGHPTKELFDQLENFNVDFLRTDQEGSIEIVSNGEKWGVSR